MKGGDKKSQGRETEVLDLDSTELVEMSDLEEVEPVEIEAMEIEEIEEIPSIEPAPAAAPKPQSKTKCEFCGHVQTSASRLCDKCGRRLARIQVEAVVENVKSLAAEQPIGVCITCGVRTPLKKCPGCGLPVHFSEE